MTLLDFWRVYDLLFIWVGPVLLVGIALMGIRMSSYWWSFLLFWNRYRERSLVTTEQLREFDVPNIKIQVTTRGSAGSSKVILRGIRNVMNLADEDRDFYR